jgi:hypothetical protein
MTGKKGKQFPKKGKGLHLPFDAMASMPYEQLIADALRRELGGSHKAIKTLMRWTGASARTAKNWLAGSTGPTGVHLICLMGRSDLVFNQVLDAAHRRRTSSAEKIGAARILLAEALALMN